MYMIFLLFHTLKQPDEAWVLHYSWAPASSVPKLQQVRPGAFGLASEGSSRPRRAVPFAKAAEGREEAPVSSFTASEQCHPHPRQAVQHLSGNIQTSSLLGAGTPGLAGIPPEGASLAPC